MNSKAKVSAERPCANVLPSLNKGGCIATDLYGKCFRVE